jgi:hypothetical protein
MGKRALLAALVLLISLARSPASLKAPQRALNIRWAGFGDVTRRMVLALRGGDSTGEGTRPIHQKSATKNKLATEKLWTAAIAGQVLHSMMYHPAYPTLLHVWFAILPYSSTKNLERMYMRLPATLHVMDNSSSET